MLTDKQMGLMNWRTKDYIRKMDIDLQEFQTWAKKNMDTFTLNNLLKDLDKYEDSWDERYMRAFAGQIRELYFGKRELKN